MTGLTLRWAIALAYASFNILVLLFLQMAKPQPWERGDHDNVDPANYD